MTENANLFGEMFRNLSQLLYISLAGNALTDIPFDIFKSDSRAEIIDLSSNLITNLSFETRYLKHLRLLNLTGNVIKSIDAAYLKTFDHVSLLLKQNPLSCSRCDSFAFIHWLFTSESTKKYLSELKCENENSEQVYVRKGIVDNLKEICNRQNIIIISSIACSFAIILVLVVVLTVRRYLRQRKYKLEMEDRVALIRQGAEPYTFVVFLSYSSNDDDFINDYVHNPLNVHLQSVIGEERDLVCEGDRNFQLGRSIPEQVSILLKKSSVVVVLLTDNYSLSVHCRNEIDQAFMLEKPIVLMIKDHVDTDLMTPNIRDLYETKTRILWIRENETYALKTSWDNVCTSIVELAGNK
ncbi:uncharacterized protein LOC123526671 [Mercenaria mercenaria]|uniref:uncharacterized protein LOC123526671 n=1 Tax=Mercenaria mercenaria TaxID=6596 RepID=UPI00234F87D9|nr:uncharacterized protein LOC123526671 [Mercenaria mercenaria]